MTHEFVFNPEGTAAYITSTADIIHRVSLNGNIKSFKMPPGSEPHGIIFNRKGQLWVTFEGLGQIVHLSDKGKILDEIDVNIYTKTNQKINPHPHGLCVDFDGKTLWFTGKASSSIGKVNTKTKQVEQFQLPTINAEPIYISAGAGGYIWSTELTGNNIARISQACNPAQLDSSRDPRGSQAGKIKEFPIPTYNSRPIAIIPSPDGKYMWFTEENGHNVVRISVKGEMTKFPVPLTQRNCLLASLTFDREGNLWTQSYIDENNPYPQGPDYIVKLDKNILNSNNISCVQITYYEASARNTVFHRISYGPDNKIWFTELHTDNFCKLAVYDRR
ncbi:Hypothetical protein HVR_LOCUS548 [uncultured virus]|nr:Hypothetical protein HVR_LOCUS548 [uncultured virus]